MDKERLIRKYKEIIEEKAERIVQDKDFEKLSNKKFTKDEREVFYEILKEFDNIGAFSIGEGNYKYILLRYYDEKSENINRKDAILEANQLYINGRYDEVIEKLKPLLYSGKPPYYIFQKIGLAHMKNGNLEEAIKYLRIADISTEEVDFSQLIEELKNQIQNIENENEPFITINMNDDYYGVRNFDQINDYVLLNNTDVESACKALDISKEQTDIVKLIYAKKYYMQSNVQKGDEFLKSIAKDKNKTDNVKYLYQTIVNNRKLYLNKPTPSKILSLTIKPATNR